MARKKNQQDTVLVTISTTPPIFDYLQYLVGGGLYGKTPSEAAERLVSKGIEGLIREGSLKPLEKKSSK